MLGFIIDDQFFWDEREAREWAGGRDVIPVVPDLVPRLARGEIVCYEFKFVGDKIDTICATSKWQEPYQSGSDVLRVTAIAEDLTQAIAVAKAAKDNFVWEDYDE